jgi:hypothetical protein
MPTKKTRNPQHATRNRDVAPLRRRIVKLEDGEQEQRLIVQAMKSRIEKLEKKK